MPLLLKPNCECSGRDLPNGDPAARFCSFAPTCSFAPACSFDRTFCAGSTEHRLAGACPNCGGHLVLRPARPLAELARFAAALDRVRGEHAACREAV